jgi:hypothetical protein
MPAPGGAGAVFPDALAGPVQPGLRRGAGRGALRAVLDAEPDLDVPQALRQTSSGWPGNGRERPAEHARRFGPARPGCPNHPAWTTCGPTWRSFCGAARERRTRPWNHSLLYGNPGLGKVDPPWPGSWPRNWGSTLVTHLRAGPGARRGPGGHPEPISSAGTSFSSTRSTACPRPWRRSSIRPWRTSSWI